MPLLFMSILAQRLHPVIVASVDCMSSISAFVPITGEHATSQSGHLANQLEHLPSLNETGVALDEHVTSLVQH